MSALHMGINMGHDRSVAVVEDGRIVVAIEQERLDRIKHSVGFMLQSPHDMERVQVPGESITYCLDLLGLPLSAMATITANMPGEDLAPKIMRGKFSHELASRLRRVPSHHLAHAYSAFWPSGFDEALVLVVDASGSVEVGPDGRRTESYSLYEGRGTTLRPLHAETVQSHLAGLSTLGFVYETVSRRAGFVTRLDSGLSFAEAGKLMGLAAFGGPQARWETWLRHAPGSHEIQISAYDLFLEMAALEKRYDDGRGPRHHRPWLVDLAYKAQAELERALVGLVSVACEETGLRRLCLAGGVGLNSVANYRLLQDCTLDDVFVFPAAADSGVAAGCAYWAYHQEEGGQSRPALGSACLGRAYAPAEVDAAIEAHAGQIQSEVETPDGLVRRVAQALSKGHIVARFESGSEFGPRALGHRSILADPTFERMKDVVNARVKFREAFRPFAPFVPLERADEVFELDHASPYMLLVAPVREALQDALPAITHRDGTGRVQTCTPDQEPFLHRLCLEAETIRGGPPVLLNTSFNVAGQPIVETPEEAIDTFLRTDIDYLVVDDRWIARAHQPVQDYAEHVRDLPVEPIPHGLEPDQPSLRPLMAELDAALFQGAPSARWSASELAALSAEGARYKETSRLFPETPFVAPLQTQLAPNATLLLDPRGRSTLVDESGRLADVALDLDQVQALLALRHAPAENAEALRLASQSTPVEFAERAAEMKALLDRFDVSTHPDWQLDPAELPADAEAGGGDPLAARLDAAGPGLAADGPRATLGVFARDDVQLGDRLRRVRRALLDHGYEEEAICALLGVASLQSIEPTHLHYLDAYVLPQTPQADLVRLFLLRASVERGRVEAILGEADLRLLEALGLLRIEDERVASAVDLFCSGGLLLATDPRYLLRETDTLDEDPVMYIGMDSHGLVQTAPRTPCEAVLDLCSGSGIQGLVASRYARRVVAVDLNPRAIRFARFNAQLNGIEGYEARLGHLYEAVAGETFDCILANPPFVPSPEDGLKFRDGGVSGETVLRAIVEGAGDHLTPEGRLCIVTDLVDVATYEEKLAAWLGHASALGLILDTADRDEILFSVPHCHAPFSQSWEEYDRALGRWIENFRDAGIDAVNFGYLLVWKRPEDGDPDLTRRTIHNPATPIWDQVEDWREQRRRWHDAASDGLVLALHPELRVHREERLAGGDPIVELGLGENPFFTRYAVEPGLVDELERIGLAQPELGRLRGTLDAEWIERLHAIGILRLETTRRVDGPGSEGAERVGQVEQRATKTTPTCLSNYLS